MSELTKEKQERQAAWNKADVAAWQRQVDNMVAQKVGYNGKLAKRIIKQLRSVYPQPIPMPKSISDHPSYHNTLVTLIDRGWIDHVSMVRTMNGRAHIVFTGSGMALSDQGMMAVSRRVDWTTVASVVAALGSVVAAITGLMLVVAN